MALCTAVGPLGASIIHDRVGSYTPAFWFGVVIAVVIAVVSTGLITMLTPVQADEGPAAEPAEAF